jgi:predicted alpha/beta superfamily hydrolase
MVTFVTRFFAGSGYLSAVKSSSRVRNTLAALLTGVLLAGSSAGCQAPPPPPSASNPAQQVSAVASAAPSAVDSASAPPAPKGGNTPIVIGESQTFHSTILGEDRTLLISTPESYKKGKEVYPVLYLLDGEEHFHHTTGITTFLSHVGRAPEMIVVGIANTADGRERDLTPTTMKDHPGSGGGAKFLSFLKDEVRPRIESGYRTAPYRILVGHSYGGLLALHVLTSAPEMFDAYIAMSPSLWWDDKRVLHGADKAFVSHEGLQSFVYLTAGNEPGMFEDASAFAAIVRASGPKGVQLGLEHLDRESHFSVPHRSTYDALEKLFTGWEAPREIATLKALQAHYAAFSKKFHFEVKPTEDMLDGFAMGNFEKHRDEAMAAFKLGVELHPESPSAYDTLCGAYEESDQRDLAKATCEIAVRKGTETSDPDLPDLKAHLTRVSQPKAK